MGEKDFSALNSSDTMDDMSKIWRYMDMAKFVSMLLEEALYFACPCEFVDPYEGYLPKSYMENLKQKREWDLDFMRHSAAWDNDENLRNEYAKLQNDLEENLNRAPFEAACKFGVNCWHASEYESEAMWKMYSSYGIAIESTIGQLRNSILNKEHLRIANVRYADFEKDQIEQGHRHYALFMKRKSFEHEKELRATVLLEKEKQGVLMKCDLDTLITRIHISPFDKPYFKKIIENLCSGKLSNIRKPVIQSTLFDKPYL